MKQMDNRQKQSIQLRAEKTLKQHKFLKGKAEEHIERTAHTESKDAEPKSAPVYQPGPKVGRNDPCPCGSGKKFKKCCLNKPANP